MYQNRNSVSDVLGLYLGNYNAEFYLREISRMAGIPLKTTQGVLSMLENSRILKSAVHGKNKYFSLNLGSIHTKLYLTQAEIKRTVLFLEKYPHFGMFLNAVKTSQPLILFGSFARMQAGRDSDIDVLQIGKDEKLPSHLLPNRIHKIRLGEGDFLKAMCSGEALIEKVKENHLILSNHSFFVDTMWNNALR